jgi:1-acyl-sn-glycerol-3-phosphate acyltransferase
MNNSLRGYLFLIFAFVTLTLLIPLFYLLRPINTLPRKAWSKLAFWFGGVKLVTKGELDDEATLFILNHQSQLDIVAFEILNKKDLCWIAKEELFNVPYFGHIMKAPRMISLKREDRRAMIALLKTVEERLTHNRPIVIFPEGTRGDGKTLLPFKSGAKIIGDRFGLKVQPILIQGTSDVLPARSISFNPGTVNVTYLPSFYADPAKEWLQETHDLMQNELTATA